MGTELLVPHTELTCELSMVVKRSRAIFVDFAVTAPGSVDGVVVWLVAVAAAARRGGLGWLHACACQCHFARQEDVHGLLRVRSVLQYTGAMPSQLRLLIRVCGLLVGLKCLIFSEPSSSSEPSSTDHHRSSPHAAGA